MVSSPNRLAILLLLLMGMAFSQATRSQTLDIEILYVELQVKRPPVLSNLARRPTDEGRQGAHLGLLDGNSTGKFLNHRYSLKTHVFSARSNLAEKMRSTLASGPKIVLVNAPTTDMLAMVDLDEAKDDLFFNVSSTSIALRSVACRRNLLHTLPSRAMLADALMQFLSRKKWRSIFLIEGNRTGDIAYANALRLAAKKFQLTISHDKKWLTDADMRRNASTEVPVFTQASDYDVVVVADETEDFSRYLLYNLWLPRPVAGSAGVQAVAWHLAIEQWGAAQLQSRFTRVAKRAMRSIDYAAWAAIRSVSEAVTRTNSAKPARLRQYLLSPKFLLAGFKGRALSYRAWNGQLRQPIPLIHPDAMVSVAPIEGFLHQKTELDTLGIDRLETGCKRM